MDVIIAGAGKVGFELAKSLSDDHQVTIIDQNTEALERLQELIDILPIVGNVEDPATYNQLPITSADFFVAVTDSDEANLLATLFIDDSIKVTNKLIRLRNNYFSKSNFLSSIQNLKKVFPLQLVAENMKTLLSFPEAHNVKSFLCSDMKLISIKVDNYAQEHRSISYFENSHLKIIGIERDKKFLIPAKDEMVEHNDLLYFFGDEIVFGEMHRELDVMMPHKVSFVVIFGANTLGVEIAKVLSSSGIKVKMIEKDIGLCEAASEILQDNALIINSHYDETILYDEENLSAANVMISVDNNDESNIVRALQAKEYGIPKVVAINNDNKYYALMHELGIVVARGSRTSAYYAMRELLSATTLTTSKHFCGGKGVVVYCDVAKSGLAGKVFNPWKEDNAIVLIQKGDRLLTSGEVSVLEEDDVIFVITDFNQEEKAKHWLETL